MNPIVVRGAGDSYGRSFKGLVRYVTDTGPQAPPANDDEPSRVVFTGTRNLPTENTERAWKLMAATAMNKDDMQRARGSNGRGRQDKGEVMHLVLSWAEHERQTLDREQIEEAMESALETLKMSEHQVCYAFHDEPGNPKHKNPHLHLAINRVHPETGLIASDYKSDRKLSRWALDYERSRGEVLVKTREENWEARDVGLELPTTRRKSRAEYEAEKATRGSDELSQRVAENQTARAKLVAQRTASRRRGETYSENAWAYHKKRLDRAQAEAAKRQAETRKRVDRAVVQRFKDQKVAQAEEKHAFERREKTLAGQIANRAKYGMQAAQSGEAGRVAPNLRSFFRAWTEEGYAQSQMEAAQREAVKRLAHLRKELHARREQRQAQERRRETTRLRAEHGERLLRFEKQQTENRAKLEERRVALDRERRVLRKLGRSAERARESLEHEKRPTQQAAKVFGPVERKQREEGDRSQAKTATEKKPEPSREAGGSGEEEREERTRKTRTRRERKPRKPREERRAERVRKLAEEKARDPAQENVLPEPDPKQELPDRATWRRGGHDGHER